MLLRRVEIDMGDRVEIKSFIFKITKGQYNEIFDMDKDKPLSKIGYLFECGAIIPDTAELILEQDKDNYYVASSDMLVRSSDGVFVRLKHELNEVIESEDLPNFKDVFKVKEL